MSTLSMVIDVNTRSNISEINKLRNAFQSLSQAARDLTGIEVGTNFIREFREANQQAEQFKRSMDAIKGAGAGGLELDRLTGLADRLGLSLDSVTRSYVSFNAAAVGTSLEGYKAAQGFEALAGALSVLGADSNRTMRAFQAVQQMISKGQVYSEELKQQLAENLPGALGIFSRALGVSQAELLALVKAGQVGIPELEKFFNQLRVEYGKAASSMSNPTLEQAVNRLTTQFKIAYLQLGDVGAWRSLVTGVNGATDSIRKFTDTSNGLSSIQSNMIAIQETVASWGRTFQQTFQEADAALNGFLSDLRNSEGLGGDFLLNALADLPANVKALFTIMVAEIGKAMVDVGTAFNLAWEFAKAGANGVALSVKVTFQEVVTSIQSLIGDMAGNLATALEKLGKGGEIIPGFRSSAVDIANALRALQQYGDTGKAKLEELKNQQSQSRTEWEKTQQAIIESGNRSKEAWDGTAQNAVETALGASQLRRELTENLQKYREIDTAEQRLWAIRVENLKSTQAQGAAIDANSQAQAIFNMKLKESSSIMQIINRAQNATLKGKSDGKLKANIDDELIKLAKARKQIAAAATDEERRAAVANYANILKTIDANAQAMKSEHRRLKVYQEIANEKQALEKLGITDKEQLSTVNVDTSSAVSAYQTLKKDIEGNPATVIIKANDDPAKQTVVGTIQWAASQSVEIPVYYKEMNKPGSGSGSGLTVPKFAQGGIVPGSGSGDRIHALLTPGEGVLTTRAVAMLGGAAAIDALNARARGGFGSRERSVDRAISNIPRFANGGVATGTMNLVFNIGNNKHQLSGSRDAVAALAKDLNKIARSL